MVAAGLGRRYAHSRPDSRRASCHMTDSSNNPAAPPARTVGILQPGYLPWLGFFEQLARCDVFVLYDDVQYDKGSWRNRNRIKTPNGPQWLTVPVLLKGRHFPPVNQVRIDNHTRWAEKHLRTIRQNYHKAPFFEMYFGELEGILSRPWEKLVDLDAAVIRWLAEKLAINTPLEFSSRLGIEGDTLERLVKIVRHFGAARFYEGAAGRDYIDASVFASAGVEVVYQDYAHPAYPQIYGDFVSHLSTIDLLLNCGPRSRAVLLGGKQMENPA